MLHGRELPSTSFLHSNSQLCVHGCEQRFNISTAVYITVVLNYSCLQVMTDCMPTTNQHVHGMQLKCSFLTPSSIRR